MQHKSVKHSCASTQFQALSFSGPHAKPHGVRGLNKHYHLQLHPKLGHGKCEIIWIPFACIAFTNVLYKPWVIVSDPTRKPCYQPVVDFTYWSMLGSLNNWNIIQFTNKKTTNEDFDSVHKVVLYGISDNISAIFHNVKCGDKL